MNDTWWVDPSQLDKDQRDAMALSISEDHLITGPPGSGKTNLLLLKGSQMVSAEKPNVLILTFTRTLREFVASGVQHYAFSADKIKTFAGWTASFLREEGEIPATDAKFEIQRSKQVAQIKGIIERRGYGQLYDAILIDEGQDCLTEEIDLFRRLGKVLFVAADERQKIYATQDPLARWRELIPEQFSLRFHYRNGEKICALADAIGKPSDSGDKLLTHSQYDEKKSPSSVQVHRFATIREQVQKAAETLQNQMKAYPDELLGIICPRHEELAQVIAELKQLPIWNSCAVQVHDGEGYVPFEPGKHICVCTAHSAKGLEFRTLHILSTEYLKKFQQQRRIAYTGVTRAKTTLSIYHSDDLPPLLASALASLNKPLPPAKLADLFKGSKNVV